ncbi:MAG: redoxin domain-containing protein [Acidobacteriaceae bacterium]
MDQFGPHRGAIEGVGAVVFIAAQKRASKVHLPSGDPVGYFASHSMAYPFLLDEGREVARAYGVYQRMGLNAINIARPATFVIAPGGQIRYIYCGADQADRAPIRQVLECLQTSTRQSITQH